MGKLEIVQITDYTERVSASYMDRQGEEYEIVFTKNYNHNTGYEERQVISVEKAGVDIPSREPIWREIKKMLSNRK